MKVVIDDKAIKDLSKIDKKFVINVFTKIEMLKNFPRVANLKKLTNFNPPYRLRVGDYRILFNVEDNILTVFRVKHRKESYK
ncbi:MAG: type II toxin-antitoxin system RelE/ParE family toxin [Melioribacteraceae bacterium]|nr:type II toxin-antitoxin system RelE/ParE family toxin [Melioribacteraceae bacterium]